LSDVATEIVDAFHDSTSCGLVRVASSSWQASIINWPAEFSFWRNFARNYFSALCRQYSSNSKQWSAIGPPDTTTAEEWFQLAPPMPGLEYLNANRVQELWQQLDVYTQVVVGEHDEGLSGFLKSLDVNWNLIGRVTFHLAENKKNPDAPFAFMATYTQGQTENG